MNQRLQTREDNRERLGEIVEVLKKYDVVHGMTPDKLCGIIEELGPTFIKLGQILSMRTDFLPKEYCDALTSLRSDVKPMSWEEVKDILTEEYQASPEEVFEKVDPVALGSASIAQVHAATLKSGEDVVIKVQRKGIHDIMNRDITLLKSASKLLKVTPVKGLVDFNQVLDEMWTVAQQEMNFLTEAEHLERFRDLNQDVAFVAAPKVYRKYTTNVVLVMEKIDGIGIDDLAQLKNHGYDLDEIGQKLADNYVKQIITDGFFHADPHPGNIRIREGQIVFLDMGMMGTLTGHDRKVLSKAVDTIARGDAEGCLDACLQLGHVNGNVDRKKLFSDCEIMLSKYSSMDMADLDLSSAMADVCELMKKHHISMPAGLSMLVRGLATIEGVVVAVSPNISVSRVATNRIAHSFFEDIDLRKTLMRDARAVYESSTKALDIPALVSDVLHTTLKGETSLHVDLHPDKETQSLLQHLTSQLCLVLLSIAGLLAAAIEHVGEPVFLGRSWFGLTCLVFSCVNLCLLVVSMCKHRS